MRRHFCAALLATCVTFLPLRAQVPVEPLPSAEPSPSVEETAVEGGDETDEAAAADNPFFSADDLVGAPPVSTLQLHGRLDLTYGHFEDSRNLDGFDRDFINTLSSALYLSWDPVDRVRLLAEVEFEGVDSEVVVDQALIRFGERPRRIDFGISYVPFGLERRFYAPSNNPLVDRPSPFRRVFPGTFNDFGVLLAYKLERDDGRFAGIEAAVTQGLDGPERDDRPDAFDDVDDLQIAGRFALGLLAGFELGVSGLVVWYEDDARRHRRLDFFGVDLLWEGEDHHIRFEYIEGAVEQGGAAGGNFRREGWYIEGMRRFRFDRPWLEGIEAVLRFDSVDENSRARNFRDVDRWAFGLNWLPHVDWRVKTQYEISDERGREISNNAFFTQIEYHF